MSDLKVKLISCTGMSIWTGGDPGHYAAALLAFTKNTRLQMTPDGFSEWVDKEPEELAKELEYMATSIASSWEFIDLIFSIQNVTRACAQQITRTRAASYAMQSQRVTDVSEMGFRVPPNARHRGTIVSIKDEVMEAYQNIVTAGEEPEDARSILPMNIQCNLLAKYNLRSWIDVVKGRQSLRAQDEYREVVEQMVAEVKRVYPWVDKFLVPKEAAAIKIIEDIAVTLPTEQKRALAKAADLLRKS